MPENNVFVNVDFSDSKNAVDEFLDSDNIEQARKVSEKIGNAQHDIADLIKSVGGRMVFENTTNVVAYIPYDEELVEGIGDAYEHATGGLANIGVGRTPAETQKSLGTIQSGQKGFVVVSSKSIQEDLAANRKFYRTAEKSKFDLKIANVIKAALLELNVITTEDKVYNIFMKLAGENSLDTIDQLQSFFYRPLEELKEDIREVYHSQKVAGVLPNDNSKHSPGQTVIPRNKRQKSPHKKLNWLTMEEMNEGIDWKKTDLQYINQNQTPDSQQMSMGGEPGNAIAID